MPLSPFLLVLFLFALCFPLSEAAGAPRPLSLAPADPSISFSQGWQTAPSTAVSGGQLAFTDVLGASLSVILPVGATSVDYIGFMGSSGGRAVVCIDCDPAGNGGGPFKLVNSQQPGVAQSQLATVLVAFDGLDSSVQHVLRAFNVQTSDGGAGQLTFGGLLVSVDSNAAASASAAASSLAALSSSSIASLSASTSTSASTSAIVSIQSTSASAASSALSSSLSSSSSASGSTLNTFAPSRSPSASFFPPTASSTATATSAPDTSRTTPLPGSTIAVIAILSVLGALSLILGAAVIVVTRARRRTATVTPGSSAPPPPSPPRGPSPALAGPSPSLAPRPTYMPPPAPVPLFTPGASTSYAPAPARARTPSPARAAPFAAPTAAGRAISRPVLTFSPFDDPPGAADYVPPTPTSGRSRDDGLSYRSRGGASDESGAYAYGYAYGDRDGYENAPGRSVSPGAFSTFSELSAFPRPPSRNPLPPPPVPASPNSQLWVERRIRDLA